MNAGVQICLHFVQCSYEPIPLSSATPGVDYVHLSTLLVFPLGSDRRHKLCANVTIINDEEMSSNRSLSLRAAILSPSSASFGGSAQSSSGVLEAVIIDDDGTDQSLFLSLSHS